MDSAADSLLALSTTAAAIADEDARLSDDDRSSSLSELDDDLDDEDDERLESAPPPDADSEAETERLQVTPENLARKKLFQISPSKLAQRQDVVDMRPEIESLTESPVSSPISSQAGSDADADGVLSDGPEADEEPPIDPAPRATKSPNKRKRVTSGSDADDAPRSQRRRTGSVASDEDKSDPDSDIDGDEAASPPSREATADPEIEAPEPDDEEPEGAPKEPERVDAGDDAKGRATRRALRKAKGEVVADEEEDDDADADAAEDSDAVDENDTEVAAKSEEEQAKRLAAMEALTALEKHFATLRDRLYDERIAGINHELALLSAAKPAHPELMRQVEAVQKYRDDKFEVEQKLLVYKIGALKNKAVAERSQIHSQYFQTVRDIRERYLERVSEHFYRIQRDRFKADSLVSTFTVPFQDRRSRQIIQQTAYNREVSILSGVAKYVGFPAAPELAASRPKDVEDDMNKMGIAPVQARPVRSAPTTATAAQSGAQSVTGVAMSGPQAEEQFLEQTPWANPQHPIHRLSRQSSNRSPMNDFLTPAHQQRVTDALQPNTAGSASTIVDPAAQVSSVLNTPHDGHSSATKAEPPPGSGVHHYQPLSTSPLDVRRGTTNGVDDPVHDGPRDREFASSPLTSRGQPPAATAVSPPHTSAARLDKAVIGSRLEHDSSPFRHHRDTAAISAGPAFSSAGRFSVR